MPLPPSAHLPPGTPLWVRLIYAGICLAYTVVMISAAYQLHKRSRGR
jgi:hypothetical protein